MEPAVGVASSLPLYVAYHNCLQLFCDLHYCNNVTLSIHVLLFYFKNSVKKSFK